MLQLPGNRTDHKPEASYQMAPEEREYALADSIANIRKEAGTTPEDTALGRADSLIASLDSLINRSEDVLVSDSLRADSLHRFPELFKDINDSVPRKKGSLEAPVEYSSKDSFVWDASNRGILYGDGEVKYQSIELKSEFIQMDMDNSEIFATYGVDSLGKEFGYPDFSDASQKIESKEMHYNFKTGVGLAKESVSKQGEGNITAAVTKKMADDALYMLGGKYTTCDQIEHPHFYLSMLKAKVRPGRDVVSGPVWLVIEDVPLFPLVLPFAFFPFTDTYSSGILMPTYGDEMNRGFYLRNGGYYLALSDYYDMAITGEIYTKGSWGLTGQTSYRKRYKYSGNISASYLTTVTGDKGLDDYMKRKDFSIKISHSQDAKANPFQTISASVDYSSSSYDRNQLNSMYSPAATQNNKGSSVSYSRRFPNSPFSLSSAMNINQRSQDSSVTVTLPDMTLTMSRIYPFKRKSAIGKEHWWDKISVNYNAQLRNSISTKEDLLFKSNFIKDWKNGIQHRSDVNATYSFFDVINISPNFSYTERWYSHRIEQSYDTELGRITPSDTTYGFNRVYNYNASIAASTTLYGFYTPMKPLQKYVKQIRHRVDPSISFSATPDFGDSKYGFYNTYSFVNGTNLFPGGTPDTLNRIYSPFEGQLFGVPGRGKSGSISFSLDNNIEAKIPDENEDSGERKISLIDKLSGSLSYNLAADSFNWSNLNTNMRLKLSKSYTLNLNMVFDTYLYDYDEIPGSNNTITYRPRRINKTRFSDGKGLGRVGRLMSTGTSYAYTFNNETFSKWFGGGDESRKNKKNKEDADGMHEDEYDPLNPNDPNDLLAGATGNQRGGMLENNQNTGEYDDDGYYNAKIPWSFSVNYNLTMGYNTQKFNVEKKEYDYRFVHAFSFNGSIQPTKNWRLTFNATYDFQNHKISYATCNITRSMHCWQMSASVIPVGPMKSYTFSIAANASMLKDLKYDQKSSPYNNQSWY